MKKAISLALLLTIVMALCIPAFAESAVVASVSSRLENVEVIIKTASDDPTEILPKEVEITAPDAAKAGSDLFVMVSAVDEVLEQVDTMFADIEKQLAAEMAAAKNVNDKAAAQEKAAELKKAAVAQIAAIVPDYTENTELVGMCDITLDAAAQEALNGSNGEKHVEVTLALGFDASMDGKLCCARFDPKTGKFVKVPCTVNPDGSVTLSLNHCSAFIFYAEADDIKVSPDTLEQTAVMTSVMTVIAVVALLGSAVTMAVVSKKHA